VFGSINSVVFFDADKLIPLNTIVLQASGANYTAVAQVSETLIACSCSEVIEIYNIESLTKVKQFVIHSDVTTSIIKLPTGNMASAGNDKTVRVWDIDGNILYTLEHSSNVTSIVTFESFLVTTEQGKTIRFWDIQNWQCKKHLSSISHAYDLFYDMKVWNDTLFIVGGVTYSYTTQGGLKQIDRNKMCCLPIKNNGKLGEVWTEKPTTPLDSIPVAPKR
jgi:WD40 repeat protein